MTVTAKETPDITARQREVYDWVVGFCESRGYSPTIRELCKAFKFASTNAVSNHLRRLEKAGLLTWSKRQSRTLRPTGGVK
jgi:repressor LexA